MMISFRISNPGFYQLPECTHYWGFGDGEVGRGETDGATGGVGWGVICGRKTQQTWSPYKVS